MALFSPMDRQTVEKHIQYGDLLPNLESYLVLYMICLGLYKRGHVPYRDSKLTRILQPALGGNANTAIICNITLAQIHADETKSCLQFASRALRVTNCACVIEILTDAALLKRQKKEIEELKYKISLLEVSNAELKGELQEIRIAFEHLAQRGLDAQVERTVGLCCTYSRHSLCQTTMCRCRAGGGSCGVSCGCLSYRCLNR